MIGKVLCIMIGVIFLSIGVELMTDNNNDDEYIVIEPCVDGLEGKIVNYDLLCEHTKNKCDEGKFCLYRYFPGFIFIGMVSFGASLGILVAEYEYGD